MRYEMKLVFLVCIALTCMALATAPAFAQSADAVDAAAAEDNGGAKTSWAHTWFNLNRQEHPWYFGIAVGLTKNTLYQGGAENYRPTQAWEGADGWTIALAARYQVFNWLAVQLESSYMTKNYGYKWVGELAGKTFNNTTNGFVDFPLLVNLSAGWGSDAGRLRVFANAGGFVGVWAHGREQGATLILPNTYGNIFGVTMDETYPYDTNYEFDDRRDNRFDGGLLFGGGLQYDTQAFSVIAEFRYSYSLSDLQKPYQTVDFIPRMNNTWIVQAGVLFNPGRFFGENLEQ